MKKYLSRNSTFNPVFLVIIFPSDSKSRQEQKRHEVYVCYPLGNSSSHTHFVVQAILNILNFRFPVLRGYRRLILLFMFLSLYVSFILVILLAIYSSIILLYRRDGLPTRIIYSLKQMETSFVFPTICHHHHHLQNLLSMSTVFLSYQFKWDWRLQIVDWPPNTRTKPSIAGCRWQYRWYGMWVHHITSIVFFTSNHSKDHMTKIPWISSYIYTTYLEIDRYLLTLTHDFILFTLQRTIQSVKEDL